MESGIGSGFHWRVVYGIGHYQAFTGELKLISAISIRKHVDTIHYAGLQAGQLVGL